MWHSPLEEMLPNNTVRQIHPIKGKERVWLLMSQICHMTRELYPYIQCKVCCPPAASPLSFLSSATSKGWGTLFWTCRGIWGSAEAVHYLPLKHRPEGPLGPCPIIQTGHLTLLPSLDYWSPFCRQSSFTERTWQDPGTHLLISQLLFIIFPSWAQNLTWPRG